MKKLAIIFGIQLTVSSLGVAMDFKETTIDLSKYDGAYNLYRSAKTKVGRGHPELSPVNESIQDYLDGLFDSFADATGRQSFKCNAKVARQSSDDQATIMLYDIKDCTKL